MGLVGSLVWVNTYSKRQCRSLFWRMRAAVRKATKNGGSKKGQFKYQYDPWSYALNFDDSTGGCDLGERGRAYHHHNHHQQQQPPPILQEYSKQTTWVYVIWVDS